MESTLHYTSVSHADTLMSTINRMRLDTDLCDVAVVVGNFRIKAHRIILSASAPFFYQLLNSSQANPTVLPEFYLDNVDETSALKIIEFCYTSTISLDADSVWPLLAAAVKFECTEISGLCSDFLISELNVSTCLHTVLMAVQLGSSKLLNTAGQFVAENVQKVAGNSTLIGLTTSEIIQVMSSLLGLKSHEQEFIRLTKVWLDHHKDQRQQVALQLIEEIPSLTKDLQKYVDAVLNQDQYEKRNAENLMHQEGFNLKSQSCNDITDGRNQSGRDSTNNEGDGMSRAVPLYICVSCGEAFDSQQQLTQHQGECDESAQPVSRRKDISRSPDKSVVPAGGGFPSQDNSVTRLCKQSEFSESGDSSGVLNNSCESFLDNTETNSDTNKSEHNTIYDQPKSSSHDVCDASSRMSHAGCDSVSVSVSKFSTQNSPSPETPMSVSVNSSVTTCNEEKSTESPNSLGQISGSNKLNTIENLSKQSDALCHKRTSENVTSENNCPQSDTLNAVSAKGVGDHQSGSEISAVMPREAEVSRFSLTTHNDANNNDVQRGSSSGQINGRSSYSNNYCIKEENQTSQDSYFKFKSTNAHVNDSHTCGTGHGKPKSNRDEIDEESQDIDDLSGSDDKVAGNSKKAINYIQPSSFSPSASKSGSRKYIKQDTLDMGDIRGQKSSDLTDELNVKCQLCGRSCPDRKSLANHWKIAHGFDQHSTSPHDTAQVEGDQNPFEMGLQKKAWDSSDKPNSKRARKGNDHSNSQNHPAVGTNGDTSSHSQPDNHSGDQSGTQRNERNIYNTPPEHLPLTSGEVNQNVEISEMINHYLQQCHQLTSWYLQQGSEFCQVCLMYHPKGNSCPKASVTMGDAQKSEVNGDKQELDRDRGFGPTLSDSINSGEVEGPLDMSKSSQEFALSFHSSQRSSPSLVTPDLARPLPLDLSQYYSNYARFMAAAVNGGGRGDNVPLPYPDVLSQLGPMDLSSDSRYPSSMPTPLPYSVGFPLDSEKLPGQRQRSSVPPPSSGGTGPSHNPPTSSTTKKKVSRQGFPCTVCNRVFSYQAALFTHMRTHSPSARTYQCQLCQQSFARAPDLKVHVCPNGVEKPYTCPSCGQTFAKNIHLKRHLATHSGQKPYACWVCGKRFSRSDHLKRHTQSIHAGSRPHGCQVCGKEFVRKYELNKHMLAHSLDPTAPLVGSQLISGQVTSAAKS